MAYLWVQLLAVCSYLALSVLYIWAISGTNGSSGFGSVRSEQIESKTWKYIEKQEWLFAKQEIITEARHRRKLTLWLIICNLLMTWHSRLMGYCITQLAIILDSYCLYRILNCRHLINVLWAYHYSRHKICALYVQKIQVGVKRSFMVANYSIWVYFVTTSTVNMVYAYNKR